MNPFHPQELPENHQSGNGPNGRRGSLPDLLVINSNQMALTGLGNPDSYHMHVLKNL